MVLDDRPEAPMMCDLELQFQGSLDATAFASALEFSLGRNPLFTCRIEYQRGGLVWIPTDWRPLVDWAPWGAPLDDRYGVRVDLQREPGLRIWVRQGEERSTILLHFHHACSDAMGMFGFIEDLLAGYASATPGSSPVTPRPLAPERLLTRGDAGVSGRSLPRRIHDVIVGMHEGIKFFWKAPAPLACARCLPDPADAPPVRPSFLVVTISEPVTLELRRKATASKVMLNDLLLRELFLVLRRWNAVQGSTDSRWLRILMPQNLREDADGPMPAANMVAFAFLTRTCRQCDEPDALLASIRAETEAVRRGRLSMYLLGGMGTMLSAGLLPWLLRRSFCFATVVMTNLSDPTRRFIAKFPRSPQGLVVGNVVFQGLSGVPPLRPGTRAAFGISTSISTFSISLRWDPRCFSLLDAQRLLGEYVSQLHVTAEGSETELQPAS